MYDSFHIDQYDILYKLDEWHTHRTSQNIFIDYRSWSGIFQTISLFINQCNYEFSDVLFLTPVQIEAVQISRSGLWGESFLEYIYESFSIEPDFSEIVGKKFDFTNLHKIREKPLYRTEGQKRPKLVVIMHAELITPKQLADCNQYLHMQTMVCFDSAMFYSSSGIVNSVHKPIEHTFLNDEASPIQKFLYQCLEKRLVPLSKEKEIKVYDYNPSKFNWNGMIKPVITITENHPIPLQEKNLRGSLIYTTEHNWNYSLEENRYYLIKGMYLVIDTLSRRDNVLRTTMHPTYTKYKFKVVPDVHYKKVYTPAMVDDLPQWKFSRGSIITPKTLPDLITAARLYNAINFFEDQVTLYIV